MLIGGGMAGYHWQELPQVSLLSWQKFVVTNTCLSRQNFFLLWQNCCHNKMMFVTTNVRRSKSFVGKKMFVATKVLSWHTFVTAKDVVLSRQIRVLLHPVATKLLSRQNYFRSNNYLWQWFAALTQFTVLIKKNAHLHANTLKKIRRIPHFCYFLNIF